MAPKPLKTQDGAFAIDAVAVIGAGTMGHGIAQVAASSGWNVRLFDLKDDALKRAQEQIATNLSVAIDKGKATAEERDQALNNLVTTSDLATAVTDTQLVIEAVPEDATLKCNLFKEVSQYASDSTLMATNTSSLSISEIAAVCRNPERFVGMHFFNPPYIVRFLELIRAEQTSDAAIADAQKAGEQMNRDMIVVQDSPGFATSRLGLVLGLEAIRMLEAGVASAEDIDKAMQLGYRHPMGPLKLTDLVGLDVRLSIAAYLHAELGEQFRPPPLLLKMVEAGKLGKKSGEGFYKW